MIQERANDPADNYLLALAQAGAADYLVMGDKKALLTLQRHGGMRIVTARAFCELRRSIDANVPALFAGATERAKTRLIGFFTGNIRNLNTRRAYFNATVTFPDGSQ